MSSCVAFSQAAAFRAQSSGSRSRQARSQRLQLVCSAARDQAADRRSVLLGGLAAAGAAVAAPLLGAAPALAKEEIVPVSQLTILQKQAILQELSKRASEEFGKVLTSADAAQCMKLLLHDAGTYDRESKTGGCNGSIVLPEELSRPENKDLKPVVEKLAAAKTACDARRPEGQAPLTWADTIVLGVKTTQEQAWREDKISKAADAEKGAFIADGFGNPIRIPLGRLDATQPDPAGRLPAPGASLEEVQAFFSKLGAKPDQTGEGPFGKKPPFWERYQYLIWPATQADQAAAEAAMAEFSPKYADWKRQYDTSKRTVTRTSYEEDMAMAIGMLSAQGARFNKELYLAPIKLNLPDRY